MSTRNGVLAGLTQARRVLVQRRIHAPTTITGPRPTVVGMCRRCGCDTRSCAEWGCPAPDDTPHNPASVQGRVETYRTPLLRRREPPMNTFTANYPGRCRRCHDPIHPGDQAAYWDGDLMCATCNRDLTRETVTTETPCPTCNLVHAGDCW